MQSNWRKLSLPVLTYSLSKKTQITFLDNAATRMAVIISGHQPRQPTGRSICVQLERLQLHQEAQLPERLEVIKNTINLPSSTFTESWNRHDSTLTLTCGLKNGTQEFWNS